MLTAKQKYMKKWRKKNKKNLNAYIAQYRKENREKIAAQRIKHYEKNREKFLAIRAKYYKNNKEKCRASMYASRKSIHGFLINAYNSMKKRVEGRCKTPQYWVGKSILPRETFYEWSRNHPDFLRLFKRWTMAGYDRKLSPSVNRADSKKGYTLDNIEWITHSQNSAQAGTVKSYNKRTAVYQLLKDL